jgi:hypothetical protein
MREPRVSLGVRRESPVPAQRRTPPEPPEAVERVIDDVDLGEDEPRSRRRGRRGGRGRRERVTDTAPAATVMAEPVSTRQEPSPLRTASPVSRVARRIHVDEDDEEIGRPEGPLETRHVDPFAWEPELRAGDTSAVEPRRDEPAPVPIPTPASREPRRVAAKTPAAERVAAPATEPVRERVPEIPRTPPRAELPEPVSSEPVRDTSDETRISEAPAVVNSSWREERVAVLAAKARTMMSGGNSRPELEPRLDSREDMAPPADDAALADESESAGRDEAPEPAPASAPAIESTPSTTPEFGRRGRKSTGRR